MAVFQYAPEILQDFAQLSGGVVLGKGLQNGPSSAALQQAYADEQQATLARIGDQAVGELPEIQAWRRAFSQFGVEPTKYRCAAESLLRRLTKKGDIPSINTLVDIGNLISIRYVLPIAVVSRASIQGVLRVHYADGSENYRELNSDEVIHPPVGEVVFSDGQGTVFARRWCWRQSAESAAQPDTTDVIITLEAQHEGGEGIVAQAIEDMIALLRQYAGGDYQQTILNAGNPAI